jgi:DNA-binding NarL/FixJ family response regulator
VREIKRDDRKIKALFVADYSDDALTDLIYKSGGMGCIIKHDPTRNLLNSIREVNSGEFCFPEKLNSILKRYSTGKEYTGYENHELELILSKKEYEIFLLCGIGLSSREIAERLLIGIKTVDYHLNNIREKLNLSHRNKLIRISARHNLLYNHNYKFK